MLRHFGLTAALLALAPAAGAVDFLGFELGSELAMPECLSTGSGYLARYLNDWDQPARPCWKHRSLGGRVEGQPLTDDIELDLMLPRGRAPRGVSDVSVVVVDGRIEGFTLATTGLESQDELFAQLKTKFGAPDVLDEGSAQNRMGATFKSITAMWNKPDVEVAFSGLGSRIDFGYISVASPAGVSFNRRKLEQLRGQEGSF